MVCVLKSEVTKARMYWLAASSGSVRPRGASATPAFSEAWSRKVSARAGLRPKTSEAWTTIGPRKKPSACPTADSRPMVRACAPKSPAKTSSQHWLQASSETAAAM